MSDKPKDHTWHGCPTDYAERNAVLYPERNEPDESIAGCLCLACKLFPARS
jgi:hypothetical protein